MVLYLVKKINRLKKKGEANKHGQNEDNCQHDSIFIFNK